MDIDVLIVGAGPTGLMLAEELARYGVNFRIIDSGRGPTDLSKAVGVQPDGWSD
jgi:2-polyprenyl-6-methoxyphenol hydroxylase-like FAD-dependent oxidoreductase